MTVELPAFLKSGGAARLIPVANGSQRERCAASVLVAALSVVRPFAEAIFTTVGKNVGSKTSVAAFTEVVFKKQLAEANCRPDGLLVVSTPRSEWRAIVEAKIGTAQINPGQLSLYCRLAVENKIDAIITISNELTSFAEHLPYDVPKELVGKVEVYHWSWMTLVTLATLLLSTADDEFDPEQHFILKEMLRYLSHENTDVRGFHQMNPEWPLLLERVQSGADVHKDHPHVIKTICAWHQEQSDICLILSRKLKVPVTLRLKKHFKDDQDARVEFDSEEFATTKRLRASFEIPNLAGPLEVTADALRRNIICLICVQAPEDRKRYESRLHWLLKQLPSDMNIPAGVHIRWKNGGASFGKVADLRANPKVGDINRPGAVPKCFEIMTRTDLGKKFSGTKNFIEILETAVPQFYDNIARHIRAWQPGPLSGPAEGQETLADTVAGIPTPKQALQRVVKREQVGNGGFSVFEDGSIEVETPRGTRKFKNFGELISFAKSAKGPHQIPLAD
jgi:hypothetical protein